MAQNTNLNVSPYYDDFNRNKDFYRVLFRPGYSVQTRELITLQSILQEQIERYGNYQFKQGELVIPGEVGLNTKLNYVKLSSVSEVAVNIDGEIVYKKYDISQLVGETLVGVTSGVQGIVKAIKFETAENSDTIFVSYISSGDSNNEKTFRQGELLEVINGVNTPVLTVGTDGAVLPNFIEINDIETGSVETRFSPALGFASAVNIQEGIYFVNGFFVRNNEQLLVIDAYNNKASAKIAFNIEESIIIPEEDDTLYDNSRGSSNFSAPGAHRLKITLKAQKYEYTEIPDKNSIELLSIKNGNVEKKIKQKDYNVLEETLARRTYDESGDYVVQNFSFDVREYVQKNGNTGLYTLNSSTGLVNGLSLSSASQKLVGTIGPGKAYVKGYEIVNKETKYVTLDKSTDTINRSDVTIKSKGGSSFYVTNVYGSIPVNAEGVELDAYPTVYMYNVYNDGGTGLNGSTSTFRNTLENRGKLITQSEPDDDGFFLNLHPSDIGIKTIWVERSTQILPSYDETYLPSPGEYLWIIQSYAQQDGSTVTKTAQTNFVKILSTALVKNEKVSPNSDVRYAEITIAGRRDIVDAFFKDFDLGDEDARRRVFLSNADAFDVNNLPTEDENGFPIIPPPIKSNVYWGTIVDYTETQTPLVGVCKPSNFYLTEVGEGFNPIKDKIASKGIKNQQESYNGIFSFSYFNPVFFTRIKLTENINQGFGIGKYVIGSRSGAFGVVEGSTGGVYSSTNVLHLTVQSGTFVEGETIVDEDGYSLEIAKSNTISHFIVHNQGTAYDQASVVILDGVIYDKSKISINRVDDGINIGTISILDPVVRSVIYDNPPVVELTNGQQAKVSAVLFKDTVHTYSPIEVKSFYSKYGSGSQGENIFTADTVSDVASYANYVKISDSTFTGAKGFNYLSVNSLAVDLSKFLKEGDIIQYVQQNGAVVRSIVSYATTAIGNEKARVYIDSALRDNVVGSVLLRISSKIENPSASLVFRTGSKGVSNIVKDITNSRISYFFRRDFVATGSSSGGSLTFAAQLPYGTQRFVTFTKENYVMTILSPGIGDEVYFNAGDIVYVKDEFVNIVNSTDTDSGLIAGSATITFPENFFGSGMSEYPKVKLTATLEVSRAKPKLKSAITNKRIVVTSSNDRVIPFRGNDYDSGAIGVFSYSDVYKLRYVYEGSLANPPKVDSSGILVDGKDVTDKFVFDNGQRSNYYDVARLILKPGEQVPTGRLVIGFDYFEHTQGEFCTVDSYVHESGVDVSEIPTYELPDGIVSLGDVIDFRPKVDTTVVTSGFQNTSILASQNYISFTKEGGNPSVTPAGDINLEYTIKFDESSYLDRIDALFVDKNGQFIIKKGNASKNPSKPDLIEDSIPLYYVHVPALTKNVEDVKIVPVENKRYTMKDIAKLEKRIERLEYYTSLSILEQQTLNMQIKDEFGFDKFKSGFLVDNFETHGIGDISSSEYVCAIDPQQSVLRPQVYEDNLTLVEANSREDERFFSGYKRSGDIITLQYTDVELLGNTSATTTINPNPFVVLQYVGDVNVNPTMDQWYDTEVVPLVTNNNTNLFSIYIAKKNDPKVALSSIFNSYLINWTGVFGGFSTINSLSDNTSLQAESKTTQSVIASSSNVSPNNNEIGKGIASETINGVSISSSVKFFARSIPVKFVVTRMKPKTRIYPFIDGRDMSRWVIPDSSFSGVVGSSLSAFGSTIVTDESGNASGILLIPAGYPPIEGTFWTGRIVDVEYDKGAERVHLTSGKKTLRFTSSEKDEEKDVVETYAEVSFYSSGIKPENPPSIISTQPSYFKSNEGIQFVESNTDLKIRPNPLAQTFRIENYDGGVFVTELDLYFSKKSNSIPIKVYLTDVVFGKPGKNIIPGTEKVLLPKTYLRVFVSGNITIVKDDVITGEKSGCSGILEKILDRNGNEVVLIGDINYNLTNEQVYTFVISNHNGKEYLQNETLTSGAIRTFNARNNTNIQVRIAKDFGRITKFEVTNVGSNYEGAILNVESPQLPGESQAAAVPFISNGILYDVGLSLNGSGYTDPPSVIVKGIGDGASGAIVKAILEIDTLAVRMGVAVDDGTNQNSTTKTTFKFDHPVYLQNDVEYCLQIETDSTDYALWTSKLGDIELVNGTKVSSQPFLGSLYKSQNTDTWVEDLFEDLKFSLKRAKFDTSKKSILTLVNESVPYQKLISNPFETNSSSNTNATSDLFRANNSIVKVYQRDHGFEDSGLSNTFFRSVENFSGISGATFTQNYYKVDSVDLDHFTIRSVSQSGQSARGGGTSVYAPKNVKFEKIYADIAYLQSPKTKISSEIKTTNVVPIDNDTKVYTSYTQSDYEVTFLNQEQFFENQKFIVSPLNEVLNETGKSLSYRLELSSDVDYLSPLIDLRNVSVKTSSTRIDNSTGQEKRYGKRYQTLSFWSVYSFTIAGVNTIVNPIATNQTLRGRSSGAEAEIVSAEGTALVVRMINNGIFESGEGLIFGDPSNYDLNDDINVRIDNESLVEKIVPPFQINDILVAFNPIADVEYTNIIGGRIVNWDKNANKLTINVEKKPINNDFSAPSLPNGDYARNSVVAKQVNDIIRVNDYAKFDGSLPGTELYLKVKEMYFENGVEYRGDSEITNTSSKSKYLTKEASLNTPATTLDVRLTAVSKTISDIKVFYRTLEVSSQDVLSNLKWNELTLDETSVNFKKKDTISSIFESRSDYQEYKYYVNDLPEFTKYQIKIVLRSSDPVFPPKIQDARVVASL